MKPALTHKQMTRLARKATTMLSHAMTMAKCLPDELGCTVAEDFAESGIEQAAEALALLAKIKCALRIERIQARFDKMMRELAPSELAALRAVRKGGEVFSLAVANTLRDLQRRHPDWLHISTSADSAKDAAKPYLSAILKRPAEELLQYVDGGAE